MTLKTNNATLPLFHRSFALALACLTAFSPAIAAAVPTIPGFHGPIILPKLPANSLPVLKGTLPNGVTVDQSGNQMNVTQNQGQYVTIDWSSFNIGAGSTVRFYQGSGTPGTASWKPNSGYAALNRIYDLNPTLIYGNLKADGSIYLINRNGILFGPNSKVDVHAIVASALNLYMKDFTAGLLKFNAAPDPNDPNPNQSGPIGDNVTIANYGAINSDSGGGVFLVGPNVVNAGLISAPNGRVKLVGVSDGTVDFTEPLGFNALAFSGSTKYGQAINDEAGKIIADSGRVEMAGGSVYQNGLIRAVTAVRQNGQIFLTAKDLVSTGPGSVTESPVSDSTEKVGSTFAYTPGSITVAGPTIRPLDATDASKDVQTSVARFEHAGAFYAPSGTVSLSASDRVFMDSGSSIDVAGLWADEPASAGAIQLQLNSVQLADSYGQKNGVLKGQNVTITSLNGSGVGDVSGAYTAADMTAEERSTAGGSISISPSANFPLAELIVKQGATLDFSGGGLRYAAGVTNSTKLLSGNNVYDISSPSIQFLNFQKVLGDQKITYAKFGQTVEYKGLYFGGGTPVGDLAPGRTVGSSAGSLSMAAGQVVLDGTLRGNVTRGQYQTNVTPYTSADAANNDQQYNNYLVSVARGLEEPAGGTVAIGLDTGPIIAGKLGQLLADSEVAAIVVKPTTVPLAASFGADTPLASSRTEISAATLNSAGLSNLGLFANTSLTIEQGANLSLLPGGSFTARARRIENYGGVNVAGGSVEFTARDNITSFPLLYDSTTLSVDIQNDRYVPLTTALYFAPGSVVSTAGVRIDDTGAGNGSAGTAVQSSHTGGGQITAQDETMYGSQTGNNLVVAGGALLDVSGGYIIDRTGKVTGGDAGSLTLRAMNLSLAGDLIGLALPGRLGGQINLHAGEIIVGATGMNLPDNLPPDAAPPDVLNGKLFLAVDRFQDSGFTRIGLTAFNDVIFTAGSTLAPSHARLPVPASAANTTSGGLDNLAIPAGGDVNSPDYLGTTALSATGGLNIFTGFELNDFSNLPLNGNAKVEIALGAKLQAAPGGSVTLSAPEVDISGDILAPGGTISLTAGSKDLSILGGTVSAAGYLKQVTTTVAGQPAGPAPQSAGTVSLQATSGSVILGLGATVDVSGTAPENRLVAGANGLPVQITVAGNAGALNVTYGKNLVLDGVISGQGRYDGVSNGTLTITRNLSLDSLGMTVSGRDLLRYQASGFDALTLVSPSSINFNGPIDFTAGRSLSLDAPLISGNGVDDVTLKAPWLSLANSSINTAPAVAGGGGRANFSLSGDWIDLTGSSSITGFGNVNLSAVRDMRLSSSLYSVGNKNTWTGGLETSSDLTLQGARIYPTTGADFTITSHGKVTILPGSYSDITPIYSAGGSLTINGDNGIEHQGLLAAPMGNISLNSGNGRVYLADGSLITTSGAAPVYYGSFDGTFWTVNATAPGKQDGQPVTAVPGKSISINGAEVIVKDGAKIDMSGGGSVYTYLFQPGLQGTTNPLSVLGLTPIYDSNNTIVGNTATRSQQRYVIMPDNSVQIPGYTYSYTDSQGKSRTITVNAVHLNATRLDNGTWLPEGTYSLLPEQFAFLPGAMIVTDLGTQVGPGTQPRSAQGYQVVSGYSTFLGSNVQSQQLEAFSIRTATDVLKEGNFTSKTFTAGDAGSMTISGASTVMAGSIYAAPLAGYKQGTLTLDSTTINVQESLAGLPAGFDFDSPLPAFLTGQLQVAASKLSGSGLGTLNLGDSTTSVTQQITVKSGSKLDVPNITLSAANMVTIEDGAQVNALSNDSANGTVVLLVPKGTVNIRDGAVVHASNAVSLNANDVNLQGELSAAAHGSMSLSSSEIVFVPDSYVKSGNGLYLTGKIRDGFANYDQVTLTSASDLNFQTDVSMTVGNTLTLDSGKFTNNGATSVVLNARNINLQNSGNPNAPSQTTATGSSLTLNAGNTLQTAGTVAFDGFDTVNLASLNDMTMKGAGALTTNGGLNLTAARVTTSYLRDANNAYIAADFAINAAGAVTIKSSNGTAGTTATLGGSLAITGSSITQSGIIEVASGQVNLSATSGDITLNSGAQILARGSRQSTPDPNTYDYTPGGRITLSSTSGDITLAGGSVLDVSGANKTESGSLSGLLDAGAISLNAPNGTVILAGNNLRGTGGTDAGTNGVPGMSGKGGSFTLDTNAPSLDLTALNTTLQTGKFTNQLNIRARQGDLTLAQGQTMSANEIVLEADGTDVNGTIVPANGNIMISGAIAALPDSKGNGGRVELYANNNLTLAGSIDVSGSAKGGYVLLSAGNADSSGSNPYGLVNIQAGSTINASGATGGTVHFRAMRTATNGDVLMNYNGTVNGASRIEVEAVNVYNRDAGTISSSDVSATGALYTDASNFVSNISGATGSNIQALKGLANFYLLPGIEIRSIGNLTLGSAWDLTTWGFGTNKNNDGTGVTGVLTLRAGSNLTINANLVDHPTPTGTLYSSSNPLLNTMQTSWGLNLTAGADLAAAGPLAVNASKAGDLTIATGKVVYTEDAPIRFASANDTIINAGSIAKYMLNNTIMSYTLASYGGSIRGYVGNNLDFNSSATNTAAIQTATGDIDISVGGDLNLGQQSAFGAIRTTGEYAAGTTITTTGPGNTLATPRPAVMQDYWTYHDGGAISLLVAGGVIGDILNVTNTNDPGKLNCWDYAYGGSTSTGVKSLRNKFLAASFEGTDSTKGIATMGGGDISVWTGGMFTSQIGSFGAGSAGGNVADGGDLTIVAGGDINGRFRVNNGTANVITAGNLNTGSNGQAVIEIARNTRFAVAAQGDVSIGAIVNADNSHTSGTTSGLFLGPTTDPVTKLPINLPWNLTYTQNTGITVSSLGGSITLTGSDTFDGYTGTVGSSDALTRESILPASVSLLAKGNINVQNNFYQAPAPTGSLTLFAGNDIDGGYVSPNTTTLSRGQIAMIEHDPSDFYGYPINTVPSITSPQLLQKTLVHQNDNAPVELHAGNDIKDIELDLTKKADISAGRDILQLNYNGENLNPTDVSSISAGRDILYDYIVGGKNQIGIEQGGPGTFIVQAGRNIDLGNASIGIQTTGNSNSTLLDADKGADLIVVAGAKSVIQPADALAFFNGVDGSSDHSDPSENGLRKAGSDYSALLAQGNTAAAQQTILQARSGIIRKYFDDPAIDGSGTISMTSSQIDSAAGKSDVYVMARGVIDIGKSTLSSGPQPTTGIYTNTGGGVNIFAGSDVNVNESRAMTFLGGDITVWSDHGDINAGRGSATTVNTPVPILVLQPDGTFKTVNPPPAAGSGIRALTYDPDGSGPLLPPNPGNIYLFAPQGVIDAGEAGIAGGKVVLGATEVLNSQNICLLGRFGRGDGVQRQFGRHRSAFRHQRSGRQQQDDRAELGRGRGQECAEEHDPGPGRLHVQVPRRQGHQL